jgi:molecular chaperone HscB
MMSATDFSTNYFALFELPEQFAIDSALLKSRYRQLQRDYHPDRFASANSPDRRAAEQISGRINQAYATLSSPLLRAEYLLSLQGVQRDDAETVKDPEFLMQQMALREALDDLASETEFENFSRTIQQLYSQESNCFQQAFDRADYQAAMASVSRLHFFDKLSNELDVLQARFFLD